MTEILRLNEVTPLDQLLVMLEDVFNPTEGERPDAVSVKIGDITIGTSVSSNLLVSNKNLSVESQKQFFEMEDMKRRLPRGTMAQAPSGYKGRVMGYTVSRDCSEKTIYLENDKTEEGENIYHPVYDIILLQRIQ